MNSSYLLTGIEDSNPEDRASYKEVLVVKYKHQCNIMANYGQHCEAKLLCHFLFLPYILYVLS
jgi:hypothetical protein